MFDPFDQVRMRTQQLLDSAARIRQERALSAAAGEAASVAHAAADTAVAGVVPEAAATADGAADVAAVTDPGCCEAKPAGPARTRAA